MISRENMGILKKNCPTSNVSRVEGDSTGNWPSVSTEEKQLSCYKDHEKRPPGGDIEKATLKRSLKIPERAREVPPP